MRQRGRRARSGAGDAGVGGCGGGQAAAACDGGSGGDDRGQPGVDQGAQRDPALLAVGRLRPSDRAVKRSRSSRLRIVLYTLTEQLRVAK